MASLQMLPNLGTAEEDVLFVEWLRAPGATIARGQPLATVETLKAAFEIESEHDGVLLRPLVAAGERVSLQRPVAVIGAVGEIVDEAWLAAALGSGRAKAAAPAAPAVVLPAPFAGGALAPVAPAARARARELGLDITQVAGTGPQGLVRVADVDRHHAGAAPVAAEGHLDAEFVAFVRRDPAAFAALGSEFKLALYRRHGGKIGRDCRLASGAVLLCERLVLGDGAVIGRDSVLEVGELVAGALLHFGARCKVRCRKATFGDNAFFTDDIEVGGGGAFEPEAELVVGSHGFVGEHVHLNPCRKLTIGDEVVISRNAVVMTHSFGPSWLRGYPSRFAPVTIGDAAQLGIGAVLFPGVDIGAGAVVLSGSSVVTAVPPGRLFGGVPAEDLKAAAQVLSADEVAGRARALVVEFARQLGLRGRRVRCEESGDAVHVRVTTEAGEHALEFTPVVAAMPAALGALRERVVVAVAFAEEWFLATPVDVTAIALEPPRVRGPLAELAAAFREFLRKRGVRLQPRTWAYRGGWL
ncbi:MAG: E3 binding domain-containing protein [Planctomycetes bacterium]|nr:E3 binding domain-containing protein [Planctomycetota bacterium]